MRCFAVCVYLTHAVAQGDSCSALVKVISDAERFVRSFEKQSAQNDSYTSSFFTK